MLVETRAVLVEGGGEEVIVGVEDRADVLQVRRRDQRQQVEYTHTQLKPHRDGARHHGSRTILYIINTQKRANDCQ